MHVHLFRARDGQLLPLHECWKQHGCDANETIKRHWRRYINSSCPHCGTLFDKSKQTLEQHLEITEDCPGSTAATTLFQRRNTIYQTSISLLRDHLRLNPAEDLESKDLCVIDPQTENKVLLGMWLGLAAHTALRGNDTDC